MDYLFASYSKLFLISTLYYPGPVDIKLFSRSTQLSMKFELLIKSKIVKNNDPALKLPYDVFILLINVKMPTKVGILTFNEHDKCHSQLSII